MPLRTLRLYETGVGYFERSGEVKEGSASALPVPAGHLDDALKSLVILNGGAGGKVTGLAFPSSVGLGVAMSRTGLPVDSGHPLSYRELLVSLKGEPVVVTTKDSRIAGRIIEVLGDPVEPAPLPKEPESGDAKEAKADTSRERLVLTVLSDDHAIVTIAAADIIRVLPSDPAFAERLARALDAGSNRSAQIPRALSLLGNARGAITFGYIAETPVWRSSYRLIVAGDGKSGSFQGWALLHNDTDESWHNVTLSLVNGQPDSFLFPLAAPRYLNRELVKPRDPLTTIPQLQDTTADSLWGDSPAGGGSFSGQGYGSGYGRLSGSHTAKTPSVRMGGTAGSSFERSSGLLNTDALASLAEATGTEEGTLFAFTVAEPFSLDSHSSALVPFLQKSLAVEPVAWLDEVSAQARNAVRFVNSTGQTLPAGTLAVFGSGGFTGETTLDRLKPGERRFVQFGNDLDVELSQKESATSEEPKRLTLDDTRFQEHFFRTTKLSFEIENRSSVARAVYVRLNKDSEAKITGADAVDVDEASDRPVAVFHLNPRQKVVRTFTVVEGLSRVMSVGSLTERSLREIAGHSTLPAADLAIAREAIAKVAKAEATDKAIALANRQIESITADIERYNEHLKALGGDQTGSGVASAPIVKRLLDAEDKLSAAKERADALESTKSVQTDEVRAVLMRLGPG